MNAEHPRARAVLVQAAVLAAPLVAAQLYFKYATLRWSEAFPLVAELARSDRTPALGYARFFAADVLEACLFFPLAVALLGFVLPPRARWRATSALLLAVIAAGAAGWLSHFVIGRFPTWALLSDLARVSARDPTIVAPGGALPARVVLKIVGALALALVAALAARRLSARPVGPRLALAAGLGLGVPVLAALALAATNPFPTVFHRGHLRRMAAEFGHREPQPPRATQVSRTLAALRAAYDSAAFPAGRPRASLPAPPARPLPNVVWIVLETTSSDDFDPVRHAGDLTHLSRLLDHALVADRHLTTSPSSQRAELSLFASLYERAGPRSLVYRLMRGRPRPITSLPHLLAARGYATRYYFPGVFTFPEDAWSITYLGFDSVWHGRIRQPYRRATAADRVREERAMFQVAADDIARARPPFFFVLRSMIGHYPAVDPVEGRHVTPDSPLAREHQRVRVRQFVDANVGVVLAALARARALERTIVVVTADHGPRNRAEDPDLDIRFVTQRTYHVPMMVYSPPAFPRPLHITVPTSHVDLAPTILFLAGLWTDTLPLQGLPLMDPRLAERVTLFLGSDFFGKSGLYYRGRYYFEHELARVAFIADSFAFEARHAAGFLDERADDNREFARLHRRLQALERLHEDWARYLLNLDREPEPPG